MSRAQVINAALLTNIFTGFKTAFQGGLSATGEPDWKKIATLVPSTARTEDYVWLEKWPQIREWVGDRQVKKLSAGKYSITNKTFESTVGVPREDLEDDQIGIFATMFNDLGQQVKDFPDSLVFALLEAGFATLCYDGQNFFDTDHPVIVDGAAAVASNSGGGAGAPWFMLDTTRGLKPLIYQERRPFDFVALDKSTDEGVVMRKEYVYGVDGRANAGYGFWQQAYGSKADLSAANYAAARAAMMGLRGDDGSPLRIRPNLLVCGPAREAEARALLLNEQIAGGGTNPWRGTAELLVTGFLA